MAKTKKREEFGDFQTPLRLANDICNVLRRRGVEPAAILEPTCGEGSFLVAALRVFSEAQAAVGVEINPIHLAKARSSFLGMNVVTMPSLIQANFFQLDWDTLVDALPSPLLVIGNPPWVTNAALGRLNSSNLPQKNNYQNHKGLDAVTGKSNFDISEWMLLRGLDWINNREAVLAVLCKIAVARKVLLHAWKTGITIEQATIHGINAADHFGAAVKACLLTLHSNPGSVSQSCEVFDALDDPVPSSEIGYENGKLIADVRAFFRWRHLEGLERRRWRSGVKHDCARVMELRIVEGALRNGLGEDVDIEDTYLYPMLKSSDVANGNVTDPSRYMLVTQHHVGEDTKTIRFNAPKTWDYLESHAELLDGRRSTIYKGRARFAVFGVGDYTFAPWRIAISGFYRHLMFRAVGGFQGKPFVLDDTCYSLPCSSETEANFLLTCLNSEPAREFFSAFVFWDAKRPITVDLLRRIDLIGLANELGKKDEAESFLGMSNSTWADDSFENSTQRLFP